MSSNYHSTQSGGGFFKKIRRFFWFSSGAKIDLLEKYDTEHIKYAGIGLTVIFTAILASLSGGYALYTVFENPYLAAGFGLLWGLIIFNLDRFIVSSMRKGDGFFREFMMAAPRIIMAVFLAIVIAKPLELRLFEKEINAHIAEEHQTYVSALKLKNSAEDSIALANLQARRSFLQNMIDQKQADLDSAWTNVTREEAGELGGRIAGQGPIYRKMFENFQRLDGELVEMKASYEGEIQSLAAKIRQITSTDKDSVLSSEEIAGVDARAEADGFLQRYTALSAIMGDEANTAARNIGWAVMLIFLLLETSPVIVKLISKTGPYDYALKRRESAASKDEMKALNEIELETSLDGDLKKVIATHNRQKDRYVNANVKKMRRGVRNVSRVLREKDAVDLDETDHSFNSRFPVDSPGLENGPLVKEESY